MLDVKFEDLDKRMRVFEESLDQCIIPGVYLVVRIDGRSFSRLTEERGFERPFDENFSKMMTATVRHLMDCGFRTTYGYTQSDEISLLFNKDESSFSRKTRKFNSVLAGEASAAFSCQLGVAAAFDCRVVPLPSVESVQDYFVWRQEDAARNALNGWCYWTLRKDNVSAREAGALLNARPMAWKYAFLKDHGIDFDQVPLWQRRGIGIYYEEYLKDSVNGITGEPVRVMRRRFVENRELPTKEEYKNLITSIIER